MNRIKKLFGICEHDWRIVDELDSFLHSDNVLTNGLILLNFSKYKKYA